MSLERKDSQGVHAKPAILPGLFLPGQPHRGQSCHWAVSWLAMGMLRGPVPNKLVLGQQLRRRIPDSDSAAHLPLRRAIASTGGTWLDQVQWFRQSLYFPLFCLKQTLVQVNFPTSQQICKSQLLWVNLEYPQPKDVMPEGEGSSVWKDDLGRGGSQAEVPLKAESHFLSLEQQRRMRYVCVNLFFFFFSSYSPRFTSRVPEKCTPTGSTCSLANVQSRQRSPPGLTRPDALPEIMMEVSVVLFYWPSQKF